ncbi:MAG: DEAD/DEAH box helicase family protein [Blautia sp.]
MNRPNLKIAYNTSENDIRTEFYLPCLKWALQFERGVGYFTSGWLEYNAKGMAEFISHGGKARWITSPILSEKDMEIFVNIANGQQEAYLEKLINFDVEKLEYEMRQDVRNLLAWMIHDGVLEMRFAVPIGKLQEGDFHDKFGNFYGEEGQVVSFSSSVNDSKKGFVNYEGIMVFTTWTGTEGYVDVITGKFQKLWSDMDPNVKCYRMTDAVKDRIFQLRVGERPYSLPRLPDDKWRHQEEAMERFLKDKNGILEMATGTGKTYTAIKIAKELFRRGAIKKAVVCTYGNDLLEQWYKEILMNMKDVGVFRYYESSYKELSQFALYRKPGILILSLNVDRVSGTIRRLVNREKQAYDSVLWIFDEIHRLGSKSLREELSGMIRPFQYRLGLSATPLREFDEAGNDFIKEEVGPVIFQFDLRAAIQRGILCEFDYIPLEYELTEKERKEKRDVIAAFEARKDQGESACEEELYRELSRINKLSVSKLPLFEELITQRPELVERCIIFVETMEYGEKVQYILNRHVYRYHTYYADDQKSELQRFSRGEIECLLTCKKLSEGVDIKSVKNIFLFSSDRGKLVTTQRIGRSLRIDPEDPGKRATIVDFICVAVKNNTREEIQADRERREWLEDLSKTRREN